MEIFDIKSSMEDSKLILIPVPWDVTTSYKKGTAFAPQKIITASNQIDKFDIYTNNIWEKGISVDNIPIDILLKNDELREVYENLTPDNIFKINEGSNYLNNWLEEKSKYYLNKDKLVGVIGGDHSSPYGLIKSLSEKYNNIGVLHIDAHADLRKSYQKLNYSHASIMYNVSLLNNISTIIQVGVRDFCEEEYNYIFSNKKITTFFDENIEWDYKFVKKAIEKLPENVYISFDIDGLDVSLCPKTGTPVPGGLNFNQSIQLIKEVVESGRKIIGFDLCEVGISENEFDESIGARVLYKLSTYILKSNFNI